MNQNFKNSIKEMGNYLNLELIKIFHGFIKNEEEFSYFHKSIEKLSKWQDKIQNFIEKERNEKQDQFNHLLSRLD